MVKSRPLLLYRLLNKVAPVRRNRGRVRHRGRAQGPIYHAGDTAAFEDMRTIHRLHRPLVAILPIGGIFTMGLEEAGSRRHPPETEVGCADAPWRDVPASRFARGVQAEGQEGPRDRSHPGGRRSNSCQLSAVSLDPAKRTFLFADSRKLTADRCLLLLRIQRIGRLARGEGLPEVPCGVGAERPELLPAGNEGARRGISLRRYAF